MAMASTSTSELCRRAAAEGCVLLTNDGTLPLVPDDEVAVFGRCQIDWFYMGYGSGGSVRPTHTRSLMEGLAAAGVRYNHMLANLYRAWCADKSHAVRHGRWGRWPTHHPEMPISAELARDCAQTARTALVVIGRSAGEAMDMPLDQGGYYLTNRELVLLANVTAAFEHTVVVLNTSNVVDLSWMEAYGSKLSAVLLAWQGGMEAGDSVADVLYGRVAPCGRLTSTIARRYNAHPSCETYKHRNHVDYTEGVFVGYRHFDALAPHDVLFPFGHGLSFTSFSARLMAVERSGSMFVARVRVTNTGPRAGRETAILWCALPQGEIPKPTRVLAAFGKTRILEPGETQPLELTGDLKTLASFDERTHSFVLEPGRYAFGLGNEINDKTNLVVPKLDAELSVATNATTCFELIIDDKTIVEDCTPLCTTSAELRERILGHLDALVASNDIGQAQLEQPSLEQFDERDLKALVCGDGLMNSKLGTPGNAGVLGGVTRALRKKGIRPVVCADGPSGVRLQNRCSLLPSATTLACTWDTELVQELYEHVGEEVLANGIDVLLAPGMNIQRDPLCGRNFEYFSEDPLLTGRMATAVVRGLQHVGASACCKHFACNNRELRRHTCDSRVSERALREIYLRGFEICVKEAAPDLVMTSYNKVNGVWAHYHYDLVTTVLREEWGFGGAVITDWGMHPARSPEFPRLRNNAYRLRAGVDVLMPGLPKGVRGITRAELERAARHVLRLAQARPSVLSQP